MFYPYECWDYHFGILYNFHWLVSELSISLIWIRELKALRIWHIYCKQVIEDSSVIDEDHKSSVTQLLSDLRISS